MIRTGIDIIEIKRIENAEKNHENFIKKVFSEREDRYLKSISYKAETMAGMYAAKEAYSKFLGTGFLNFSLTDVEVLHKDSGKPYIVFMGIKSEADLSISHSRDNAVAVVCGQAPFLSLPDKNLLLKMRSLLPERKSDANKGDFGRIFILGGSLGMTGAPCLSAAGALRSGAGLVTVGTPASQRFIAAIKLTEAMTLGFSDVNGVFSGEDTGKILKKVNSSDVCAVGMGMGRSAGVNALVWNVLENSEKPLVIDADGINAVSENIDILKKLKVKAVLTPHPGEMSRLIKMPVSDLQKDRVKTACSFAEEYGTVTVLKGENTVIADSDGKYEINKTGNPGMATGGTGDVLAGVIASFIGQGLKPFDAAVLSVYLHGRAGDIKAKEKGVHGLIASDVAEALPLAIKELLF